MDEERDRVAKAAAKSFKKKVSDRAIAMEARQGLRSGSHNQNGGAKRKALSEHPLSPNAKALREEPLKQQTRDWRSYVSIARQAMKMTDAFEDKYGRLEEPDEEQLSDKENQTEPPPPSPKQ